MSAELRRLLAEATPGPWEVSEDRIFGAADDAEPTTLVYLIELALPTSDSALIVAAVNALPRLLDVVDAARRMSDHVPQHHEGTNCLTQNELRAALARLDGAS